MSDMETLRVTTDERFDDHQCAECKKVTRASVITTVNLDSEWDAVQAPPGWFVSTDATGAWALLCSTECFHAFALHCAIAERAAESGMGIYECRYGSGVVEWVAACLESEVLPTLIETHGSLDEEPAIRRLNREEGRGICERDGNLSLWDTILRSEGPPRVIYSTEE